jgi:branched-chain amino acid transport system ATP-binding protein
MAELLLTLKDVRAGYDDAVVLDGISLDVREGESLALLGRNGVGKSTLMLTLMGFTQLTRGSITWQGKDISRLAPHLRARRGLGWVAQERDVFPSLTVEENLTVTARPGRWSLKAAYDLFPRLQERRGSMGNHLSGGEQQMLAIARALLTNPTLLLLDEPMEGLAPVIVEEVMRGIERMTREQGMTVILVEQHADIALELTQQAVVLERGIIVHRGRSAELLGNQAMLDRYIGLKLSESET